MDFNTLLRDKLWQATLSFLKYVQFWPQWSDSWQAAWG